MIGKIKIDGVEKTHVGRLSVDWDVHTLDSFKATLLDAESLTGYVLATIERDDVEIFGGRVQNPMIRFGVRGTGMTVDGYDYTVMLQDYLTPSQSLVDEATAAALAEIIVNTGFNVTTEGVFGYISLLETWNTWFEFVTQIELWTDTTVELDLEEDPEVEDEVNEGTWTGCTAGLKSCFFYDGATQRVYTFAKNAANDLYYYHSVDGVTWVGVDTTYNPVGDAWSVAWYNDKVYLFIFDGAWMDFYRGTITDATGAIAFAFIKNNVINATMRFGPVWDNQGDMWIVSALGNGTAYESTDDGATWNNRFGPGATELWGLASPETDLGDMMGIVLDVPNTDLEEWLWDQSAGGGAGVFAFAAKIDDENDVDMLDVCQDAGYNVYVVWVDGDDLLMSSNHSGSWDDDTIDDTQATAMISIGSEGYSAYIYAAQDDGIHVWKYWEDDELQEWFETTYGTASYGSIPRGYLQDGQIAIFLTFIDDVEDDLWSIVFTQLGIRLVDGVATGSFRTETVTAHGGITQWGLLTSENTEINDDWEILNAANATLVDDITTPYDLHFEGGLDPAVTVVKVYCDLIDAGTDPYVIGFEISDRVDEVTMDTDYEDCFIGVSRLADLAGAEFWVVKDNGTYTLHFSTRRGSDKSNLVILKNSKTPDYPAYEPNIKLIEKTFDWDRYANCIQMIGGTVADVRVEAVMKDHTEIAAFGQEVWKPVRDADILTEDMARQKAAVELQRRNAVTLRITGRFLDEYDAGDIEIGDSVTLVAEWEEASLKISGSHRIIQLSREYSAAGEQVSASFSNQMKAADYWAYMKKTDTHERWLTA